MENVRRILEGPEWSEVWLSLGLKFLTFTDLGLRQETADSFIWRLCQQEGLLLVTANRNADTPDSLGVMLRTENPPSSLPIVTVADHEALRANQDYVRRVSIKILEVLFDIENLRGAGRLFAP